MLFGLRTPRMFNPSLLPHCFLKGSKEVPEQGHLHHFDVKQCNAFLTRPVHGVIAGQC